MHKCIFELTIHSMLAINDKCVQEGEVVVGPIDFFHRKNTKGNLTIK